MEENNLQSTSTGSVGFPQNNPDKPKSKAGLIIFIILGILLIAGGVIFFLSRRGNASVIESPSPSSFFDQSQSSPVESSSPLPSASPVSKASIKIQVLNGTGIPGEASFLQGLLNKAGYNNVTAGNSDTSGATITEITYGSSVSQAIQSDIETRLKLVYTSIDSNVSSSLTTSDIKIVTGTRKGAASATPKPSASASATPKPSITPTASPTASPTL